MGKDNKSHITRAALNKNGVKIDIADRPQVLAGSDLNLTIMGKTP